ncbi:hypothetical protein P8610_00470 [Fictibacillus sp. UD]|uniref:hypothetical protein n=1 Tax=Fictibacillus sp. UD TaxID=3038777 RepID=UPI0037465A12
MNTSVKIILIIFLTIFVIFAGWIIYAVMPAEGSAEKPFIVKESSDFSSLSRRLKKEGFVKNPFLFNVYSTITGKKEKITTGEHTLAGG